MQQDNFNNKNLNSNKNNSKATRQIICKVKYNVWGSFETIGLAFTTFEDLVAYFSIQFYPFNFSVNFFDKTENKLIAVGDEMDYMRVYNELLKNGMEEMLLIVYIMESGTFLDDGKGKVRDTKAKNYSKSNRKMQKCK